MPFFAEPLAGATLHLRTGDLTRPLNFSDYLTDDARHFRAGRAHFLLAYSSPPGQDQIDLLTMAGAIERHAAEILAANHKDLNGSGVEGAMRDRLLLTAERVRAMAAGMQEVASLADPVGEIIREWKRPNGLLIRQVRVPLGVIGIIYESRPNVTVDTVAV